MEKPRSIQTVGGNGSAPSRDLRERDAFHFHQLPQRIIKLRRFHAVAEVIEFQTGNIHGTCLQSGEKSLQEKVGMGNDLGPLMFLTSFRADHAMTLDVFAAVTRVLYSLPPYRVPPGDACMTFPNPSGKYRSASFTNSSPRIK